MIEWEWDVWHSKLTKITNKILLTIFYAQRPQTSAMPTAYTWESETSIMKNLKEQQTDVPQAQAATTTAPTILEIDWTDDNQFFSYTEIGSYNTIEDIFENIKIQRPLEYLHCYVDIIRLGEVDPGPGSATLTCQINNSTNNANADFRKFNLCAARSSEDVLRVTVLA